MPLLPPLVQMAVLDTTKYMAGMKQISGANLAAAAAASSSAKSMTIIGSSLTRHLTLPIVAVGAAVARFESSMTKMKSLVGISEKQYKSFAKTIMEFSPKSSRSADELAQALYFITSSGYKGAKAMEILKVSAKAAAAGLGQTQVTADAVTSAMMAYSESNLTAKQATDVLIAAVREGKAEPEQLAHSIGRVIAPAKIMGISFDQVTGSVASMTLQGLDCFTRDSAFNSRP
jgi:TP901 family phage tail tape measure protein